MIKYLKSDFDKEIENKKILVDFYADWCGPCKMLTSTLEEIEDKIDIDILKVDVDKFQDIAIRYNVYSIPNISVFDSGKLIKNHVGYMTSLELLDFLKK